MMTLLLTTKAEPLSAGSASFNETFQVPRMHYMVLAVGLDTDKDFATLINFERKIIFVNDKIHNNVSPDFK